MDLLTSGDTTSDNTSQGDTFIQESRLFFGFDGNVRSFTHFAHFASNFLIEINEYIGDK